jgi:hypothetical protein
MNTKIISQQASEDGALRTAMRCALNGNAILFLGAGAAKAAKTKSGTPLPTGQQLSDALASDCGLDTGYSLDSIAEHFIEVRSETALINALRRHLKVSSIGTVLKSLASVPWSRIWTTNYDDAFEKALEANNVSYYSLTTAAEARNAQGNKLVLLHINGALDRLKQSLTKDFVLTSQSYATQVFVDTEWSTIFRNDLQRARAVIFVGYSLADIDVARLIFNPEIFRAKIHFIDRRDIDPVLKTKLSRFGMVHSIGLEELQRILEDERAHWTQPTLVEAYQCWSRLTLETGGCPASDDNFYELVLQGIIRDELLLSQIESPDVPNYTIVRACEDSCVKYLGQPSIVAYLSLIFPSC